MTGGKDIVVRNGAAEEYAAATGRTVGYLDGEGRLWDKDGNPTEKTPLTLVIPLKPPIQ